MIFEQNSSGDGLVDWISVAEKVKALCQQQEVDESLQALADRLQKVFNDRGTKLAELCERKRAGMISLYLFQFKRAPGRCNLM